MICIYARQSVDKKDSISIESQIEACRAQISYMDKDEDIKVYVDKGYSGKNTNRPDFGRMMNIIESGSVSKVIVYKLDRISRSLLDFAQIIEFFKKHNIDFISSQEKFDTSTPMGNAMLSIIMVFAQLERETIQLRIKDNYYARGKLGMYLGGRAPFGFKKVQAKLDGKKTCSLDIDEDKIETLIYIYEQYAHSGKSLGKITKELNENQIKSPTGGVWDSCKLSRILRNPVYVKSDAAIFKYYNNKGCIMSNDISEFIGEYGCYLYGKRQTNERKYSDVTDHTLSIAMHKGVIESDVFLLCQYKLDNNKQIKRSGASAVSWLSGLTKCPYCGFAMTVSYSHKDIYNFVCSGRKNKVLCGRKKLSYGISYVEAYVEKSLFDYISNLKDANINQEKTSTNNENYIKLYKIEEQIKNLIESLAIGNDITAKYINEKITRLDREKNLIMENINKYDEGKKTVKFIEVIEYWNNMTLSEKKEIAKIFIEKILFYDDKIQVVFK